MTSRGGKKVPGGRVGDLLGPRSEPSGALGGLWEHLGGQKVDFGGRSGEERGSEIDENVAKRVKSENREVEGSKVGVDY